jgi:hypothetical protein
MAAVIHGPGDGERHQAGASSLTLKATSEDTRGRFFLSETVVEPGFPGPPLHRHRELTDMFYVLEGVLTLRVGDEEIEAGLEPSPACRREIRIPSPSQRVTDALSQLQHSRRLRGLHAGARGGAGKQR